VTTVEKYHIHEENDFKEWENYHTVKAEKKGSFVQEDLLPSLIRKLIEVKDG